MAKKAPNRVTKTRGKLDGKIINSQIEIRPIIRGNLDLGKWANATRIAESQTPRRVQLNDMYAELAGTDGHWIGVWAKRVDAITSAEWLFTDKEGNPVDEINELIDTIGFEDILTELINSKGWGKTLLEPKFFINENEKNEVIANLIPRNHYRPDLGIVTKDQSSDVGIQYKEGIYARTVMDVGKDKDLGLFLAAAGYAILKRGAVGDWASFVEKFGQGIIDGEWDGYNDAQRLALSKALEGMGSGGVIIRPAGTKITAIMPTGNATGQLQMSFTDFCNKEMSKCLLGSTETIDSSKTSGYAQSETHNQQDEKKNETDIQYVRRYLNSQFIKILIAAGFNVKGGTFILVDEKHIPEKDAFKIHKEMALELKIPISHDFFYEKYGMPKPDDYDAQLAEQKKTAEQTPPIDDPTEPAKPKRPGVNKDDPKEKDVKLSDRIGIRRILDFFQPARSLQLRAENETYSTFKHHLNDVYTCKCDHHNELITLADTPPKFSKVISDLILKIWELKTAPQDQSLFEIYADELTKAVLSGFNAKADIADWSTTDTRLINALKNNVIEFSGAKTEKQSKDMTAALVDPNGQVRSWRDFKLVAEQIANTQLNWLKTEYETAIGSGQMAAKWALIQEQKELFPLLQFDAVIDEHSTDLCSSLDRVIKPVDDDFWKIYFPLNHFKCRSSVRQLRDGEITPDDEIEFPANMPDAFKRNLAAEGLVFPKNYYKDAVLEQNRPHEFTPSNIKDYDKKHGITVNNDIFKYLKRDVPLRLEKSKLSNGAFFYPHPNNAYVNIPPGKRAKWKAESVIYHEYGHAIDHQNGFRETTEVSVLMNKYRELFKKDGNKLYKEIDAKLMEIGIDAQTTNKTDRASRTGAAHDTLMALNKNFGLGHTKAYFSQVGKSEAEFIAHMFENKFIGNDVFKEVMPTLYDDMIVLLEELLLKIR